ADSISPRVVAEWGSIKSAARCDACGKRSAAPVGSPFTKIAMRWCSFQRSCCWSWKRYFPMRGSGGGGGRSHEHEKERESYAKECRKAGTDSFPAFLDS